MGSRAGASPVPASHSSRSPCLFMAKERTATKMTNPTSPNPPIPVEIRKPMRPSPSELDDPPEYPPLLRLPDQLEPEEPCELPLEPPLKDPPPPGRLAPTLPASVATKSDT